jgi:hypothetical protein
MAGAVDYDDASCPSSNSNQSLYQLQQNHGETTTTTTAPTRLESL